MTGPMFSKIERAGGRVGGNKRVFWYAFGFARGLQAELRLMEVLISFIAASTCRALGDALGCGSKPCRRISKKGGAQGRTRLHSILI